MDEVVSFFQICHSTDQPLWEQHQREIAAKKERKEANRERDAGNKKHAAACRNTPLGTSNEKSEKRSQTENLCRFCKQDGYDVTWNSCSCHNFCHPNYHQPSGSLTNHSWDKPSCDRDDHRNIRNRCRSRSRSRDRFDHQDCDHKPAARDCKGQSYHAEHCGQSRFKSRLQSRSCSRDSQSLRHDHGHYIHHDDYWGRKRSRSPVAPPRSRSDQSSSPPWAKSPPVQHQDFKIMRPFPSVLPKPRYNGYHAQLILFLHLLQMIITAGLAKMMILKCISAMRASSGTTVMKTLIVLGAPRTKNILARGLQQFDQRENSSASLKVDKKVYLIGWCLRSKQTSKKNIIFLFLQGELLIWEEKLKRVNNA